MLNRRIFIGSGLATAALAAHPSFAQTNSSLRMAIGLPVTSIDPHFYSYSPNIMANKMLYDTLVKTGPSLNLQPNLAKSWKTIDELTWEFALVPGVRFHNGEEFTADDVAFTIARVPVVPNSPSAFTPYIRDITEVEVVDPHTVRLHTANPTPLLAIQLRMIAMLNKKTHENATTEDFNSGRAAIGTGPFKFVSFGVNEQVEVSRNEEYWGEKPVWTTVLYRSIVAEPARTAALLTGEIDVLGNVPGADLARLRATDGIDIDMAESRQFVYLGLNFAPESDPPQMSDTDGGKLDRNPLRDIRVRQALSLAIDRQGISGRLLDDMAVPTLQPAPAGSYGHAEDVIPPAADRERAIALLAEAGYPQGFRITLSAPSDSIQNGPDVAQAVAQMWARIGVQAEVHTEPGGTLKAKSDNQELSAWLSSLVASGGEPSPIMVAGVATFDSEKGWGSFNGGRYSNPEIDETLASAMQTMDDAQREELFQQLARLIAEDLGVIPLYTPKIAWAVRDGFDYAARADGYSLVQEVSRSGG